MTTPASVTSKCASVFFLLMLVLPGSASTAHKERREPADRAITRIPYAYPIIPGMREWEALDSHAAMVEATLVPEARLAHMRTQALVETVLTYPLFWDAFLYSTTQAGVDAVAEQSNAITELYRREDAGRVLLQHYGRMSIPAAALTDDESTQLSTNFTLIETLLAQEPILASLTVDERQTLLNESVRVASEKAAQPDTFGSFGLERTGLVAARLLYENGSQNDPAIDEFVRDGTTLPAESLDTILDRAATRARRSRISANAVAQDYWSDKDVKTPRGTKVMVIVKVYEFNSREKRDRDDYVKRAYPKALMESGSSRRYNCHSFAWHSQSSSNTYWIPNPYDDLYWTDKSYVPITSASAESGIPKEVPKRSKVSYPSASDHSAIKISDVELRSKWGDGPVMWHKPDYSPYTCTGKRCKTTLTYYRIK